MTGAGAGEVVRRRARQPPARRAMLALASLVSLHGGAPSPWARSSAPGRGAPPAAVAAVAVGSISQHSSFNRSKIMINWALEQLATSNSTRVPLLALTWA